MKGNKNCFEIVEVRVMKSSCYRGGYGHPREATVIQGKTIWFELFATFELARSYRESPVNIIPPAVRLKLLTAKS